VPKEYIPGVLKGLEEITTPALTCSYISAPIIVPTVPKEYIPGVLKGLEESSAPLAMHTGLNFVVVFSPCLLVVLLIC
jgi:hypothetical protein